MIALAHALARQILGVGGTDHVARPALRAQVATINGIGTVHMRAQHILQAQALFGKQGLSFQFGVKVTSAKPTPEGASVSYQDPQGQTQTIACDRVLVCVGRWPNTDGLQAKEAGLELDRRGAIPVDEHFRTKVPGLWAIGDVIPGPMLAHLAEHEGIAAVETMAGQPGHVNYEAIPHVIYTHPEIASLGKTTTELDAAGVPYKVGKFPLIANGRALRGQTVYCVRDAGPQPMTVGDPVFFDPEGKRRDGID